MIILDTNVLSEMMLLAPNPAVAAWLDLQPRESVWTTSVTVLEIRRGILDLPNGKKRTQLADNFHRLIAGRMAGRIASFDESAAEAAAVLVTERERKGVNRDLEDSMIAGIVIARYATLATRNIKHYDDLPGKVVNPWPDPS